MKKEKIRHYGFAFCGKKVLIGEVKKETVTAMLKAEDIAKNSLIKGYHDVNKFFQNLDDN